MNVHDFPSLQLGQAVPYGVYDIGADTGWVSVGQDGDTAAFAVETIQRWWHAVGARAYPEEAELLITADAGGSNGYRLRLWKAEPACRRDGPGNHGGAIEHRLFSHILMNWVGKPLTSHQVAVSLIAGTNTHTGLTVRPGQTPASFDQGHMIRPQYAPGACQEPGMSRWPSRRLAALARLVKNVQCAINNMSRNSRKKLLVTGCERSVQGRYRNSAVNGG